MSEKKKFLVSLLVPVIIIPMILYFIYRDLPVNEHTQTYTEKPVTTSKSTDISDNKNKPVPTVEEVIGGNKVYVGGTYSTGNKAGYVDLTVENNSDEYRNNGGHLYIHETGWLNTSDEERKKIVSMFKEDIMYETSAPQMTGSVRDVLLPYYTNGVDSVVVNFLDEDKDAENKIKEVKQTGKVRYVAPIYSPNSATSGDNFKTPFDDTHYDYLRKIAILGGAICTDAPPEFFFDEMDDVYRKFFVDELTWANKNNVKVIVLMHPRTDGLKAKNADFKDSMYDFNGDCIRYVKYINEKGIDVYSFSVLGYFSETDPLRLLFPLGNEDTSQNLIAVANNVILEGIAK